MGKPPDVTDAEWAVLEALWDHGPQTAGDVAGVVGPRRGWADRTVKTLLARLVEKGAAAATPDKDNARRFVYRAAVRRDTLRRAESRSFVDRVFGGDTAPAVLHLVEAGKLSPDDIANLRRELDKLAGGQP